MKRSAQLAGLFLTLAVLLTAPVAALAQQTNTLDTLRQSFQKQEQALQSGYGKSLDGIMADLKKKGDLDAYVVIEAEKKRFEAETTVPAPADAKDSFRPASEAYHKAVAELLRKYVRALDSLIKQSMAQDKIDDAKKAKQEKTKAEFMLADVETKTPKVEVPKTDVPDAPASLSGTWSEALRTAGAADFSRNEMRVVLVQSGSNRLKASGRSAKQPLTALWQAEGTIENGEANLAVVPTKAAPKEWGPVKVVLRVSDDGMTLTGPCLGMDGRLIHEVKWTREGKDKPVALQSSGQTHADYPSIAGTWKEGNLTVVIRQPWQSKPNQFRADCNYRNAENKDVLWVALGTISVDGKMDMDLDHRTPANYKSQKRSGELSPDGKTITGRAVWDGGAHDFTWTK